MLETQPIDEVLVYVIQQSNDAIVTETLPNHEVVVSEIQQSNEMVVSEIQQSNEMVVSEIQQSNEVVMPETQTFGFDDMIMLKAISENELANPSTDANNQLSHSEIFADNELEQLANSQTLTPHYDEQENNEAMHNNHLVSSQEDTELPVSDAPSNDEITNAETPLTLSDEDYAPETQPSSKVVGTSHLKRHIAKGTCSTVARNRELYQSNPHTPNSRLHRRILNVVMEPFSDSDLALFHAIAACKGDDWSMLKGGVFSFTCNQPLNGVAFENLRPLLSVKNTDIVNGQLLLNNCIARTFNSIAKDLLGLAEELINKIWDNVIKYVKTSATNEETLLKFKQLLQTANMKVQNSRLSFLILMIILIISQLSSCCEARRWMSKEIEQTERSSSFQKLSITRHFYTKIQQGPSAEDFHPIYGVSLRDVPGGPNPLHN
ncbi:hypothetical protein RIF29_34332 [Crotalaria pallida]|uniref:Uncharacterized protein n=1 Tax=Crotalaria pallida TaxID=3830 RepID=A0AAN9E9A2_CROPI